MTSGSSFKVKGSNKPSNKHKQYVYGTCVLASSISYHEIEIFKH